MTMAGENLMKIPSRFMTTSNTLTKWVCMCGEQFNDEELFKDHVNYVCEFKLTSQELKDCDL
jgi:hypothetical protein